ncbi:MAG: HNH endonuclease [Actinobacteria bacterium]|nr:HNH endonuclease [Actinomycetota bacterium]
MAEHKLLGRDTCTPAGVSQVRGPVACSLNSPGGVRDSETGLKTPGNNSDATLTARGRAGKDLRVPSVCVLNLRGEPLMPTSPRKARVLLGRGKARVVKRTPFTIQLTYTTGETRQPVTLGVDSGYSKVGVSAVTEKKEVYSTEVQLRTDIVKLNSERRSYRRNRRHRKVWHRKPRFLNRKKPEGWLAPSIQHKLDSHARVINEVKRILPVTKIVVEVGSFDVQKIKNPDITGKEYQEGDQYDFANVREYVLYRDNHTCQNCKGRSKDPILQTHHLVSRRVGGDRPDNLLTLCKTCHDGVSAGEIILKAKPVKGFKAEAFMNVVRWRLVNQLREEGNDVTHTYGYLTKSKRVEQNLSKSHTNDAFVIAGGNGQVRSQNSYLIKQVRNCNRKLFRGNRSHIPNNPSRFIYGFQRFDKVFWAGQECFIFGRRSSGYFDLKKLDGTKIHASAKYQDLSLLESAGTLLVERKESAFLPHLKEGVSSRRLR